MLFLGPSYTATEVNRYFRKPIEFNKISQKSFFKMTSLLELQLYSDRDTIRD